MRYAKTIRDAFDDEIEVEVYGLGPGVSLKVDDSIGGRYAYGHLTPKQARRLAKALRKAAKIAEENA